MNPPQYRRKKNTLIHGDWEEHKYIAKVKRPNGKYRYFYSNEEYQAYLKGQEEENGFNPLDILSGLATVAGGLLGLAVTKLAPVAINAGRDFVDGLLGHKYVKRITLGNGEYRYFYSEEEYERYLKREEYQENEPDFMKVFPEYDCEMSMSDNMEEVNPNYPYGKDFELGDSSEEQAESTYKHMRELGYDPADYDDQLEFTTKYYPYSVNCSLCSLTYELRERGYDVEAKPNGRVDDDLTWVDYYNTDLDWISTVYEKPKSKSYGTSSWTNGTNSTNKNDILKDISKEPVGSRGEIAVYWRGGGGHSVVYTVEDDHRIVVRDTQTNDTYTVQELLEYSTYIRYTRTDNLKLKEECTQYVRANQ